MNQRILVPLMTGLVDNKFVALVAAQARASDAEVILLHVLPHRALHPDQVTSAEARARAYLDGVAVMLRCAGVPAAPLVRAGEPARVIIEEAATRSVTLLILGQDDRAGRFGMKRPLASGIALQVSCPVLLCPERHETCWKDRVLPLPNPGPLASRDLGLRMIALARVVGSASRSAELGIDFRPRRRYSEDTRRFEGICAALRRGETLPPIEVFKLGFGYYVRDGHHRVAAARQLGRTNVLARVVALVPLGDGVTSRALARRVAFEQATGLREIGATRAESYDRLLEVIQAIAARNQSDLSTVARAWAGDVFFPLWRRIRAEGLTRLFPGERPADLVARLVAWSTEQTGSPVPPVTWDAALTEFIAAVSRAEAA